MFVRKNQRTTGNNVLLNVSSSLRDLGTDEHVLWKWCKHCMVTINKKRDNIIRDIIKKEIKKSPSRFGTETTTSQKEDRWRLPDYNMRKKGLKMSLVMFLAYEVFNRITLHDARPSTLSGSFDEQDDENVSCDTVWRAVGVTFRSARLFIESLEPGSLGFRRSVRLRARSPSAARQFSSTLKTSK